MMTAESCAYGNRWRSQPASAKAVFASMALIASFIARPPLGPLVLAAVLAGVTLAGAGVRARSYVRTASVPWSFLLLSAATIAVSLRAGGGRFPVTVGIDPAQVRAAVDVLARSAAALSAMLFLALTTPVPDIIALARRCRVPASLVEMMGVSYRSLFVLSAAMADMRRAQASRLGHSSFGTTIRSLGQAVGLLAVETWRRSIVMHQASVARCGGGELRFLEPERGDVVPALAVSLAAGVALLALAAVIPGVVA